jgi:hypothetical protein
MPRRSPKGEGGPIAASFGSASLEVIRV